MVFVTPEPDVVHWLAALAGQTTGTVMVQPPLGTAPPLSVTALPPIGAVSVPPVQVVVAAPPTCNGAGRLSVTAKPLMDVVPVLPTLMVRVLVCPALMEVGENVLMIEAGMPQPPPDERAEEKAGAIFP